MPNFYCAYCGHRSPNIPALTSGACPKSPNGKHIPYEGSEKSTYTCKYCGIKSPHISTLTAGNCPKNPVGKHHFPTL
ncbi:MAG: hypothetical protein LBP55_05355 [Candidatus Adiutrix sp.]|nr:hypothetical protein [Candidatus Adiutrix sp.]